MKRQHARLIEGVDRVEHFLDKNSAVMERAITSAAHENFSASRARMEAHMVVQDEHTRGIRSGVAIKGRLADQVIQGHMRPIALSARKQLPRAGSSASSALFTSGTRTMRGSQRVW